MHPALTLLAPKLFKIGKAAYQQVQLINELKALPHPQALQRFDTHVQSLTAAGRIGFAFTLSLQVNQEKDVRTKSLLEAMQARLADPVCEPADAQPTWVPAIDATSCGPDANGQAGEGAWLARWVAMESDTERRVWMANHLSGLSVEQMGEFNTLLNATKADCEERIQYHCDNEARIVAGRFFEDQMPYQMLVARTGRHDPQWQRTLDALQQERDRFSEALSMVGDALIALLEQSFHAAQAQPEQKAGFAPAEGTTFNHSAPGSVGGDQGPNRLQVFVSHCWKDKEHPHFGELCQQLKPFNLWIDKAGIGLGEPISRQVESGIRSSELMVLLWSAAASRSEAVRQEIETAHRLGKTIIPCLIDSTPLSEQPLLDGLLAIDLTHPTRRVLGWLRLNQTLLSRNMQRLEREVGALDEGPHKWARLAKLAEMRQRCAEQEDNIQLMLDSAERIANNAGDRNCANPYMLAMCSNLAMQLKEDPSPEKRLISTLMPYVQEVFTRLPGDDPATIAMRNTLLAARIQELDPSGHHPSVRMLLLGTGQAEAPVPEAATSDAA